MEFYAFVGAVVAAPVLLLLWVRRHQHDGTRGTDPAANRDIAGRGGVPGQSPPDSWPSGGL